MTAVRPLHDGTRDPSNELLEAVEIVGKKPYALGAIHRLSEKFSGTYTKRLDGLEMSIQEVERLHAKRDNVQARKKLEALHCSAHYIFLESLTVKAQQDLDNFVQAEKKAQELRQDVFDQFIRVIRNSNFLRDYSGGPKDWELEERHLTSIQADLNRLEESIEQYQFYDVPPIPSRLSHQGDYHIGGGGRQIT